MQVRPAAEADLDGVLAVVNREIRDGFAHFGMRQQCRVDLQRWLDQQAQLPFIVAVDEDGTTIGFARASRWKDREAYTWSVEIGVYVSPDAQGRGVGRALYTDLFPRIVALGYRTIVAGIALPNPPSVRLHEAFGMKLVGTFPDIGYKHGQWIDVAYWVLNVGDGPPEAISSASD